MNTFSVYRIDRNYPWMKAKRIAGNVRAGRALELLREMPAGNYRRVTRIDGSTISMAELIRIEGEEAIGFLEHITSVPPLGQYLDELAAKAK